MAEGQHISHRQCGWDCYHRAKLEEHDGVVGEPGEFHVMHDALQGLNRSPLGICMKDAAIPLSMSLSVESLVQQKCSIAHKHTLKKSVY